MRRFAIVLVAFAVFACGQEVNPPPEPEPEPTGYSIRKVDLWLENPQDICRDRKPEFLSALTDRVKSELDPPTAASFAFEDFNVTSEIGDDGRLAILRFRVSDADGGTPMMIAAGPFVEDGCEIGDLDIAEGTTTLAFD